MLAPLAALARKLATTINAVVRDRISWSAETSCCYGSTVADEPARSWLGGTPNFRAYSRLN